jgi:hypothetical protein
MANREDLLAALASKGVTVLPKLTEQDRENKRLEIEERNKRNESLMQRTELNEADAMDKFYESGNRKD